MRLCNQVGAPVSLGRQIGTPGGQGTVYEVAGNPQVVAKIYHSPLTEETVAKLKRLQELSSPRVQSFAAFPIPGGLLYENRIPRGFVMLRVSGKEIHHLYGPKERFAEFPSAKWDFLVQVARNCAAAFDEVHKLGVVIGDVNERNILVSNDGLVKLLDCDSYQVNVSGRIVTCGVGNELWTPPELQGRDFTGLVRTTNHDLFGLAVMIFRLLFMGRHPFAGIPTRSNELMIDKAIAAYLFAFSPKAWPQGIKPPKNSIPLDCVTSPVASLFELAFLTGSAQPAARPTAERWTRALDELKQGLITCARDSSHHYCRPLSACPWCAVSAAGGPDFFISASLTVAVAEDGSIGSLWGAILRQPQTTFQIPDASNLPLPLLEGTPIGPEMLGTQPEYVWGWVILAVSGVCLFNDLIIIGIVGGITALAFLKDGPRRKTFIREKERRKSVFNETADQLGKVFQEMSKIPDQYRTRFEGKKQELKNSYERLLNLDREKTAELQKLNLSAEELQRRSFLDRQRLANAKIDGIGPSRLSTLIAYGIESALDIKYNMGIPGIGPTLESTLMGWKRGRELCFRYDPSKGIPEEEMRRFEIRMRDIRQKLETELKEGPRALVQIGSDYANRIRECQSRINGLIKLQAQAHADLSVIKFLAS